LILPIDTTLQVAQADGEVIITNDGATILNKMKVEQPAAKMLVDLAKSQVSGISRAGQGRAGCAHVFGACWGVCLAPH